MKKLLLLFAVLLQCSASFAQIDTEPNNNIAGGADVLSLTSLTTSNMATMSNSSDNDYFKVNINQLGVVVISVSNTSSPMKARVTVYNSLLDEIAQRDAVATGGNDTLELLTRYTGDYYIRVQNDNATSSSSQYEFGVTLHPDANEFNQKIDDITPVTPLAISHNENNPTIIQGNLWGYCRVSTTAYGYLFNNLGVDIDCYKITTGNHKGVITLLLNNAPANLKFRIGLFDINKVALGERISVANGDSVRFELLTKYDGVYYVEITNENGNLNGNGNTSSLPYTLNIALDTIDRWEYNNDAANAAPIHVNEDIQAKIRGHYRTNFTAYGYQFNNLNADIDYYKLSSCGNFLYTRLKNVPSNLRFKITVYDQTSTNILGSKTANFTGDTVTIYASDLSNPANATFIRIEDMNSNNIYYQNTSPEFYTLHVATDAITALSIGTPATTVPAGQSVTFTATPTNGGAAPTYEWSVNGQPVSGANQGTFTINTLANNDIVCCKMKSNATCAEPDTASSNCITMNITTGVNTLNTDRLNIFPNPNNGIFTIKGISTDKNAIVYVTNLYGQQVSNVQTAAGNDININLDVPAGIYFVTVATATGKQTERITVR